MIWLVPRLTGTATVCGFGELLVRPPASVSVQLLLVRVKLPALLLKVSEPK